MHTWPNTSFTQEYGLIINKNLKDLEWVCSLLANHVHALAESYQIFTAFKRNLLKLIAAVR